MVPLKERSGGVHKNIRIHSLRIMNIHGKINVKLDISSLVSCC